MFGVPIPMIPKFGIKLIPGPDPPPGPHPPVGLFTYGLPPPVGVLFASGAPMFCPCPFCHDDVVPLGWFDPPRVPMLFAPADKVPNATARAPAIAVTIAYLIRSMDVPP